MNLPKDRISIDFDLNEWDFIKAGIKEKSLRLLDYFDRCLDERLKEIKEQEKPVVNPIAQGWTPVKKEEMPNLFKHTESKPTKKAPYGYKVDGTPKKKPGRKV